MREPVGYLGGIVVFTMQLPVSERGSPEFRHRPRQRLRRSAPKKGTGSVLWQLRKKTVTSRRRRVTVTNSRLR